MLTRSDKVGMESIVGETDVVSAREDEREGTVEDDGAIELVDG